MASTNKAISINEKIINQWTQIDSFIEDSLVLLELSEEEEDPSLLEEVSHGLVRYQKMINELELNRLLSGETDSNSAYISINSGAGGTEACDWAQMLFRMYTRYAEKMSFSWSVLEMTEGDEAGLKSATIHIEGAFAHGYLKAETGVHRLVRISPFDSNARRHTSFASVFVWPEIDDSIDVEIKTEDIRIDTYRASGAGGQHVNRTDSAVRITHEPSGIVVQCQSQRSQHANKDKAMKMLKAALYEKELEERNREKDQVNSQKMANEWGSQIRSYVAHPYQMVKDHRTLFESSKISDVLGGDLQLFINAFLQKNAEQNSEEISSK